MQEICYPGKYLSAFSQIGANMAEVDKEREAFLIKIGQAEPVAEKPKPTAKKDEE